MNTKNLFIDNNIVVDEKEDALGAYVEIRNTLIHRLVAESIVINFDKFYEEGKNLLFEIWSEFLTAIEEKRKGLPERRPPHFV